MSLFDESTSRRLEARKTAMTSRLASCSLMHRDGVRWVPDVAENLLNAEFTAVECDAAKTLKDATEGKGAEDFVETRLDKIAKDCASLASMIAPGRTRPENLVDAVKADLTYRLRKNLAQGMVPGISRSRIQISLTESDREGPWDQVQTLLSAAARLPREIVTDPRRMLGLVTKPEDLLAAFNLFDDPLAGRYLDRRRVDDQARDELELIKAIQNHPSAKPKQRAHALFRLVKGHARPTILAALTDDKASE